MGNRAVITTAPYADDNVGIYVHWNGGRASVEGFLDAARRLKYRGPKEDCYGMARLCGAIGLFFSGELSLGVDLCRNLDCDNGDNGTYLVADDWTIVGRMFHRGGEEVDAIKSAQITATIIAKVLAAAEVKEAEPA